MQRRPPPPPAPAPPRSVPSPSEQSSSSGNYGTYFLGRYRVVDEIGVGGMASVHLARMDGAGGFQKWVAIKRIHPHLIEDEQFIHMFLDEARIAARISHPNVAQVFDLGQHEDTYWIAMEYLHGEPLREVMRYNEEHNIATSPILSARIVADAAEGLHAAHELKGKHGEPLNLVHRDVSPHNLFVTYDGMVKVVDFGIAKVSGGLSSTRAGTLKGKLAYMSPEQVSGAAIDRRTDIFALGVVLWEMVCGRRLFRMDNDLDTLQKVQACVVPPPSSVRPEIPLELESIILKALRANANERYQTAREFSRALHQFLMKSGSFVGPEEVGAYVTSLFSDRISKREAHLRWAAEVTQTISLDQVQEGESSSPSVEEISVQSLHGETAPTVAQGARRLVDDEDLPTRAFTPPNSSSHAALPPMPKPPPAHGIHRPPPRAPAEIAQQPVNAVVINAPSPPVDDYDDEDDEEDIATVVVQSRSALLEEARSQGILPAAGAPAPEPARRAPTVIPGRSQPAPVAPAAPLSGSPPQQYPVPGAGLVPTPITPEMAAAYGLPPGTYVLPTDETMQLAAVKRNNTVIYIAAAVGTFFVVISIAVIVLLRSRLQQPQANTPPVASTQPATTAPPQPSLTARPQPTAVATTTSTTHEEPAQKKQEEPSDDKKQVASKPTTPHKTSSRATHRTSSRPKKVAPSKATSNSSAKPGYLSVVCRPACDAVVVAGRNRGPSPVLRLPLRPGSYSVILRRRGSSTKVIPVSIKSGQSTARRVSMN